jgi:hypothetical protein
MTGRKDLTMYDKERKDAEVMTRVAAYREAASLYPIISKIVWQFDGKCFNCKLQNAIQAAGPRVYIEKRYRWLEFTLYLRNVSGGLTIAQIPLESMPDGKRIPAALILENMRKARENFLKQAADLEESMDQVEFLEMQLEHFRDQIQKIRDSIPSEIRSIYRLNYNVSR